MQMNRRMFLKGALAAGTVSALPSFACAVLCAAFVQASAFGDYRFEDPRNYFGVWSGPADERVAYAKTMGYSHILYVKGMEDVKGAAGLRFIIKTPEYIAYPRSMDEDKEYTPEERAEIESMCAMKDASAPFPHNMASGRFADQHEAAIRGTTNGLPFRKYSLQANFQKKEVVDKIVSRICEYVKSIEERNPKFKFGGFCWDVPDPTGDFYGMKDGWPRPKQVTLAHWTGKDSVSTRPGEELDYKTYSEGFLRYRIALRRGVAGINPKAAFIVDPWNIGRDWVMRFVNGGFDGEEFREARADFVMSEGPDHFFAPECFTNGFLRADQIAYSCDLLAYDFGKEIANVGLVASRGAWSVWFGNPCPTMPSIRDVPPRMKLAHELPRFENLNNTPLELRRWDAQNAVYDSPTAHVDKDVIWMIHPYTKRLYFCFMSPTAVVKLPDGFKVEKVNALTSLFNVYRRPKLQNVFSISDAGELRIAPGHEYVVGEAFIAIPGDRSAETKFSARREETLKWFSEHQFGVTPIGRPDDEKIGERSVSFEKSGIKIDITCVLPEGASAENPAPVMLFGDHMSEHKPPFGNLEYKNIPTNTITGRGYAYVRWNFNDVAPNSSLYAHDLWRWPVGIIAWEATGDAANTNVVRKADSWGTLGAWAWGHSRVMDWIETRPELDARRVAVVGHSRGGKTALWAAAQDERFAMAVSNGSGCGGARLGRARDPKAEKFKNILNNFPNWFCPAFTEWIDRDAEITHDADDLLRLIAPRCLYVASGSKDAWAGPAAEKAAWDAAHDAWREFGLEANMGYHCHEGPHKLTPYDWEKFLDFADASEVFSSQGQLSVHKPSEQ